jgi:ferrochelatase
MSVAGKTAIVLFNLGGPDSPEAVAPFLRNLFSDPAIIALPWFLRLPLAWTIARGRAPVARDIYAKIGGASPIVRETQVQARALEAALAQGGIAAKAFIAMRYWHPFSDGAARAVKAYNPDKIVLLPLYPQFSTTTTASSLKDWKRAARKAGLDTPVAEIHC